MGMTIEEFEEYAKSHNILTMTRDFYETRLKADLKAILVEIQLEIEEKTKDPTLDDYDCGFNTGIYVSGESIQQKIDVLGGNTDG